MFSMSKAADYADVFLNPDTDASLPIIFLALVGVGFLLMFWAFVISSSSAYVVVGAGGLLVFGGVLGFIMTIDNVQDVKSEIYENMQANVKEKYGADLKLSQTLEKSVYGDLDQTKTYTLKFDNGASSSYQMYFKKSGEPVVVNPAPAPTVDELNSGKETSVKESSEPTKTAEPVKTVEPKTAPTPSELEESAKK